MKPVENTVRCAIIGVGTMGKRYARMIGNHEIEGLSLSAVCCHGEASAQWAKEQLDASVRVCRSEDALYAHGDFDAVLIVTPHRLHPAMTVRALREGKHVMCDKPPGITVSDAKAMNAAAEGAGKVYAMMCHQRTYAQHREIKRLLDESFVGKIRRVCLESTGSFRTFFYHASSPWRSSWTGEGGGALINQGYHLVDLWQYLFGQPLSVYAAIPFGKYNDFAVDDEATLVMEYPDKMTGAFILTTGEGRGTERLEIAGRRGRILLEDGRLTATRFDTDLSAYARQARVFSREALTQTEQVTAFGDPDRPYHIMLKNFARAILAGEALIAPGADGVKAIEMINAAYLSAWEERKVRLPLDEEQYEALLHAREAAERE